MNRPIYESPADRANERDVIAAAQRQWPSLSVVRLPRIYPVDYWATLGDRCAPVEIKCRNYTLERLDNMGGLIISLQKWSTASGLCAAAGVPLKVWLRTADGYWQHTTTDFRHDGVVVGGRTDRNDREDVEPCIMLRRARFMLIARREAA